VDINNKIMRLYRPTEADGNLTQNPGWSK